MRRPTGSASSTPRRRSRWRGSPTRSPINVAANRGHEAPGERRVPRGDEAGRVPHQHLARLGGGRGGAGSRRSRRRKLRAGLDVFQSEPAGAHGRVRQRRSSQAPGVYGTHHVGASTDQAQVAIAHEVIRIVQAFRATGEVPNVVNRLARSSATPRALDPAPQPPGRAGARVRGAGRSARSTWKRSRTSSITAPRPRWRGSTSTARRATARWSGSRPGNADIISVELSEIDGRLVKTMSERHLQLLRRPRRPARARAPQGAGGDLERRRQRHRHHGAQPPGQGVRQDPRRGRAGLPRARRHPGRLRGAVPPGRRVAPVLRWCR